MASISTGSVGCNILVYVVSKGRAKRLLLAMQIGTSKATIFITLLQCLLEIWNKNGICYFIPL